MNESNLVMSKIGKECEFYLHKLESDEENKPKLVIDLVELNPFFVRVDVGYRGDVHDPTLGPGDTCCLFHFV